MSVTFIAAGGDFTTVRKAWTTRDLLEFARVITRVRIANG
jgi:hypothetical protein